jgi:hypothetical protein
MVIVLARLLLMSIYILLRGFVRQVGKGNICREGEPLEEMEERVK